jgi:hypothetical protein
MAEPRKRGARGAQAKVKALKAKAAKSKARLYDPIDTIIGLGGLLVGGVGLVAKVSREAERARIRAIVMRVLPDGKGRQKVLDEIDNDRPDPFKLPVGTEDPKCT